MTGILWDLDGTLLDTLEDLKDGVNHVLTAFGYPCRTLEEVRCFVGNGARRLLELAAPENADVDALVKAFHEYYDAHCMGKTKPFFGIPEALDTLKEKYPMAIVSNKPDSAVKPLCDYYFPGIYARGERQHCPRKPAPDMILQTMADLGVERCVYVGDSEVDILTAKNVGVPCLAVLWGFRSREELEKAGGTYFCETPDTLAEQLEEMVTNYDGK